ncbi:hypothetical protein [Arthrobacter sp. ok909]|uniref:hypothetical protein n=1 Tax=Arthrobacter sp. ok909 TaxID=1761746 RepID=UPI001113CDFB|nr:hypothetical protein [Arthrobacter sp. ok909]
MKDDESARPDGARICRRGTSNFRPWKKPIAWLSGIVVAALGVAITNSLVPRFGQTIEGLAQTGDPVTVNNVHVNQSGGLVVALPRDVQVADEDATSLSDSPDQLAWFESQGGALVGMENISITVTGNREGGVRIMDLTPVKKCSTPLDGTYFESPPAGGSPSLTLSMTMDDPRPQATTGSNPEGSAAKPQPYFVANTVSLAKGEQFVFVLDVGARKSFCTFELDISVLDGNTIHTQRIDNNGVPFRITAALPHAGWRSAYLGGVDCMTYSDHFRPASDAWLLGDSTQDACK